MSDAPELPEASDAFERRIAISIAVMAVLLSFIGNIGDNAKTDSILHTMEASNQWAYFQSKSTKQALIRMESRLLKITSPAGVDAAPELAKLQAEEDRYDKEKGEVQISAVSLTDQAKADSEVNNVCDLSSLLLQIAVVIASVAILVRWHLFWWISLATAAAGAVVGARVMF